MVNTHFIQVSSTDHYLPVTDVKFAGSQVTALIDSGASVSLLENSVFQIIKHDASIKPTRSEVNIKSISGDSLQILGSYSIPITFGNKRIRQRLSFKKPFEDSV